MTLRTRGKPLVMQPSGQLSTCPSCAAEVAPDARFCPGCGTALAVAKTVELDPIPVVRDDDVVARLRPEHPSPALHRAQRRPFGLHPVTLLGGLGTLSFLLGLVLLGSGSVITGLVLLVLAGALASLFVAGVRRDPDAPAARATRRALGRARSWAGLGSVGGRASTRAGVEWLRLRRREHRLRRELNATLTPLGEAVHRDEAERAEALRRRAAELEQSLGETKRASSAALAAARDEIEHERRTVEPTEALRPLEDERPS